MSLEYGFIVRGVAAWWVIHVGVTVGTVSRKQEGVSQLELATVTSLDDADIDSEGEEAVYEEISILYEPEASEDELTFARWVLMMWHWIWPLSMGT